MEGAEGLAAARPTAHALLASTPALHDFNLTALNDTAADTYYFFKEPQVALLGVLLVAIVVGNSSLIAALLFTKARKSRMNFFIMQLAIADLLVGLIIVMPDLIHKLTMEWHAGDATCKMYKFIEGVVLYASTYVLVALSIDRCDAITNPMNFSGSWNRARALVASAWVVSVLLSIPFLVMFQASDYDGKPQCWLKLDPSGWRVWVTFAAVSIVGLPTLIIAACYTIIVLTIWNQNKAVVVNPPVTSSRKMKTMKNGSTDVDPDSRRASSRGLIPRAKIKSVKMSFVIVFVFVLCWSPYMAFGLLQVYGYMTQKTNTLNAWATLIQSLAPLNSVANPLICCLFSPHIYAGLKRIPPYSWCCGWLGRRRGARDTLRSRSDSTAHSDLLSSTHTRRIHNAASLLNSARRDSADARHTRLPLASAPRD